MPITSGTDVRWCERCQRKAASSYCGRTWLCSRCFAETHTRDRDGTMFHGPRGERLPPQPPSLESWMDRTPRERLRSRDTHRTR